MNKILAVLFAISCFATSAVSNSIMGVGMWFWIIIATGIIVAASQFLPVLGELGRGVAMILAVLSVCAVLLTFLAATIGGSFELGGSETLLVISFTMIAIFGFSLTIFTKKNSGNTNN